MMRIASLRIFVRAIRQFSANGGTQMGAALAYYAIFSTAPLLVLAVTLAGAIYGEDTAQTRVLDLLTEYVGDKSSAEIGAIMQKIQRGSSLPLIAALVVGAMGVFLHVRSCLCRIWNINPPLSNSFLGTLVNYLLAMVMVLGVGVILLASLVLSTTLAFINRTWGDYLPGGAVVWRWADLGGSFALVSLFFALVYWVMSGRVIRGRYLVYAAVITSLLFSLGKILISYYLVSMTTISAFGAAGSLVMFLIWIYYSAQIFFFGAEMVQARRTRSEWLGK